MHAYYRDLSYWFGHYFIILINLLYHFLGLPIRIEEEEEEESAIYIKHPWGAGGYNEQTKQ